MRRLAISYTDYKRTCVSIRKLVFKLDLDEFVLIVDAEDVAHEDGGEAVMIEPRGVVRRRSRDWKTWEDLSRSEARQLGDVAWQAKFNYQKALKSKSLSSLSFESAELKERWLMFNRRRDSSPIDGQRKA